MPLALLPLLPGLAAAPPQALNANNEFLLACRCCSAISPAQLTGTLPPDIFVRRPNLLGLVLSGNRLHGTLPSLYGRSQVGPGGGCERAAAVLSMPVCELTRGALGCTCVAGSMLLGLGVQGTPLELVRLHCSGHTISKCCMVPVPAAGRPSSNHRHALPAMQAWGLQFAHNPNITGPALPAAWLEAGALPHLVELDLSGCAVSGTLPPTMPWPLLQKL